MSDQRAKPIPGFDLSDFIGASRDLTQTRQEAELLERCFARPHAVEIGHELAAPGALLSRPKVILSGWVGLSRLLNDGRRQIVDVHIPGDLTAFRLQPDGYALASYVCLTPVRYGDASEIMESALARPDIYPAIFTKMRRADEEQLARLFDHIVRVGRMLAHERLAHFALDLYRRHDRLGLCTAQSFPMPLTQDVLGDILGMSTVHVNRTLQQLRRDGVLKTANGRWQILDIEMMRMAASEQREYANAP